MTAPSLVEHFFRHEYGKLVAALSHRVGIRHIDAVEDAVQSALMTALSRWHADGVPNNPTAWLFTVAYRNVVGELRKSASRRNILLAAQQPPSQPTECTMSALDSADRDLLRMLFVCCEPSIPAASQLVFALKTLCGFSVPEIAARLFTTEANTYKRLTRARQKLRASPRFPADLSAEQYRSRLPIVHAILYQLFAEGHLSSHARLALRLELCDEAIRLGEILAEHTVGKTPQTFALVALMHLHRARANSRQDDAGGLLLLEEQDRDSWDQRIIAVGLSWLAKSAAGDDFSRYHAEAAIAAEHCLAPSFELTRWEKIADAYATLERAAPSALHRLNRAVAITQCRGPEAGLRVLDGFEPPTWLVGSYMWSAVLADLHRRNNDAPAARQYRKLALEAAPTAAIRALLERRLKQG